MKNSSLKNSKVAIIMGSETDLKVMQEAANLLTSFKIKYSIEIVSAHRTPDKMFEFADLASSRGFSVIIAGAGGAAHLPGMVASLTDLPVIGVPIEIGSMKGIDALLSIAQMPKGVPVATVAVNNAHNAGLLAAKILAAGSGPESSLSKKLKAFRQKQKTKVREMNQRLKTSQKKAQKTTR